jgi:hypothetical protein
LQQGKLPKFESSEVQRHDRERIRVQRNGNGDRKVDAESDREQGRGQELHWIAAGYQAGKHTCSDTSGDGSSMQMPEVVMLKPRSETRDVTVLPDAFVAWQKFSE